MSFGFPAILILALFLLPVVVWVAKPRHLRQRVSVFLRGVIVFVLVLALAQPEISQPTRRLSVIFVLDASDSMGKDALNNQLNTIETTLTTKAPLDEWGVIVFGANSVIEQSLSSRPNALPLRSQIMSNQTNIADALNKALALLPSNTVGRIVLMSDGQETQRFAEEVARRAQSVNVEIYTVPYAPPRPTDARISALNLPSQVAPNQPFDLTLEVMSDVATSATLLLYSQGQLLSESTLTLGEGANRFVLEQQLEGAGLFAYTAEIIVPNDAFEQNNALSAVTQVTGSLGLLVVADDAREIEALLPILENTGFEVTVSTSARMPSDALALSAYEAVVIANIPATSLTQRQQDTLEIYVRDTGGGLVFIGGDKSYGVGGYAKTTLERLLPLEVTIKDDQRLPQLTIAYLIDTSGSMQASADGINSYLQLGQQALLLSLDVLQPTDRVAIANFDSNGKWIARFQNIEQKSVLSEAVASLQGGGGTDILAGLRLIESEIYNEPSPRKHLILFTDGGSSAFQLVDTAERLYQTGEVTLSVVALGANPPVFLEQMAEVADGNYHRILDANQIPRIFAQEAVLASRSYLIEETFTPVLSAFSPIMDGINALPTLAGYVATSPKEGAQIILRGTEPYQDPILASWQVGLGRVVAFTSDASARWGAEWANWTDFGKFWGQAISWAVLERNSDAFDVRFERVGDTVRVTLDALEEDGTFLNGLSLAGSVSSPTGREGQSLGFAQTSIGQYEATFTPSETGAYGITVVGQDESGREFALRKGWVNNYSDEYAQDTPNTRLLDRLAELTGGVEASENLPLVFAPPDVPNVASTPIWEGLLWLACLLWVIDIAVRRLIISASDLARLRAWLTLKRPQSSDTRLDSLLNAKARATTTKKRDDSL